MVIIDKDFTDFSKRHQHILDNLGVKEYIFDIINYDDLLVKELRCLFDKDVTPAACNTDLIFGENRLIILKPEYIEKCGLTQAEIDACIFHEMGHYINLQSKWDSNIEMLCDSVAVDVGLSLPMLTTLFKINNALGADVSERVSAIRKQLHIFRPIWTCGRYNSEHHAAIFYNLLEGLSYYFEDVAADIIGMILSASRNGEIDINSILKSCDCNESVIFNFFEYLREFNLLTLAIPNHDTIEKYRAKTAELRCNNSIAIEKETKEKLPVLHSTAESEYTARVGGITSVMFELTYRCSEMCIHCYNPGATRNNSEHSTRADRQELGIADYKRIIDELYEAGLVKVSISGGDPFSKEIVWDIIDYIYKKDLAIDIFTNGQRIVDYAERLADFFPRTVGISIYSGKPEEHDFITRIPNSWNKSMSVVQQLSKLSVPLYMKCCVMRPNVKHYNEVADLAKQYGAQIQYELSITDSIEGDKCARDLRLTPELMEIVLRDNNVPLYVGKEAPNYGGQRRNMDVNACGAGVNTFCISPEGNLMPCCALHLVFENLKQSSLKDALKSTALSKWQSLTLNDYEECGRHEYCDYCNLCPGTNYSEHSTTLKASENNCYMAKIRHSLAAKMMNEGYDPLQGKSLTERLSELQDYKPQILRKKF